VKPPAPFRSAPPAWRRAALVTVATGLAGGIVLAALPSAEVWASLAPGDCREYCEASTDCGPLATRAAVQQPANAWSSLAFLFAGALAWRRPLRPLAVLFTASCALLAIGSFAFHASITRETQWLDMTGTYAAVIAVAARGIAAACQLAAGPVLVAALVVDALFAAFKWAISAWIALPLLIAAGMLPIWRWAALGRRTARAALLPAALLAGALAFRQLDAAHVACDPASALQGHAVWHVLCAASLAASWFFFEPEGVA
jgi:hypothetical protein